MRFMDILSAILQGIVQGLTEFLPVSSSGHLAIYQHFGGTEATSGMGYSVVLHIGTLFAVCLVYRKTIGNLIIEFFGMLKDVFTGKFSFKNLNVPRRTILFMILSTLILLVMFIPVGNGMNLKDCVEMVSNQLKSDPNNSRGLFWIIGVALLGTAALMFVAHYITSSGKKARSCATIKDSLIIGAAQALATTPGLSRSGTTTATALALGLEKSYATEYSFILSIPAVAGATLLEFKDLIEATDFGIAFASENIGSTLLGMIPAIIGMVVAAIVGIAAIKTFIWLINKNRYIYFAYYCAAMGIFVIIASILGI